MERKKKICLITPNHISTNPRLVKEGAALDKAGYAVHIIFTQNLPYLSEHDNAILQSNPSWTYSALDWTGCTFISRMKRLRSAIMMKGGVTLNKIRPSLFFSCLALNRHLAWQQNEAIKANADLYIAHNLGALPVAISAAKRLKVKAGFDAEDYHRQEETDDLTSADAISKVIVENAFIPQLSYFTAASPLIGDAYHKLYSKLNSPLTVLNVFPRTNFPINEGQNSALKLFWFSQKVGKGRGIEDVIYAISLCQNAIELHLLGFCTENDRQHFLQLMAAGGEGKSIYFYPPVQEMEIFRLASQFHIGLATETGVPFNREICLTNKIFTYIQSGLAIVASDTLAQRHLLQKYAGLGCLYQRKSAQDLADVLDFYHKRPDILESHRQASHKVGQEELNWDLEQKKFLDYVKTFLN